MSSPDPHANPLRIAGANPGAPAGQERLYHLALRDFHTATGAAFTAQDGWSLPADYSDPAAELAALRESAVAFDRSHRSRFLVTGTDALDVLRGAFAGHIEDLEEGRAMRAVAVDGDGAIRDLVLIARTGGIAYFVSGEPGQRQETYQRLRAAIGEDFDARVDDRTETTCLIAIAGPAAAEVASAHLSDALPARLQLLHTVAFEFHGFRTLAIRTSDTGEDGFEFMVAPAVGLHLLETLREAGVALAGAQALEIARVEACIPAFRPDLEPGLSPGEADLDVLLDVEAGSASRILSAAIVEAESPLPAGTPVLTAAGDFAGQVRSCVHSPGLGAIIALVLLDTRHALPGVDLLAAGSRVMVASKPLFRRRRT